MQLFDNYKQILLSELVPALGCTEPIAIALSCSKANELLQTPPTSVDIYCSGNIIKNVKAVVVPNSGGLKGIEIAAALGIIGGNPSKMLQVLESVLPTHIEEALAMVQQGKIKVHLVENEENLYLKAILKNDTDTAIVEIKYDHTRFNLIQKNDTIIYSANIVSTDDEKVDTSTLKVKNIIEFAQEINLTAPENQDLVQVLDLQIKYNSQIAQEGLTNKYGAEVGKTILMGENANSIESLAVATAAAGSDARMGGCSYPVVINSGSGNQGMTVSLPVIEYAKHLNAPLDKLHRALILSNLLAIHQKRFIGKLSAFCGVVSASAAAGSGIAYLLGFDKEQISMVITNTLATSGGMVCDGAKPSCASKIAVSLKSALMAVNMSKYNRCFVHGDGLVGKEVEETIENIGRMARLGMKSTDIEILRIMLK